MARAQAAHGAIPQAAADAITRKADIRHASVAEIDKERHLVQHRMVALVNVWRRSIDADARQYVHYGATTVDICAPGSAIMSTVPKSSKGSVISGYASYSGTSMATPHVSGAAALYAAQNGGSAAQIKAAIMGSAVATASCNGKVVSNGRLNVSGF